MLQKSGLKLFISNKIDNDTIDDRNIDFFSNMKKMSSKIGFLTFKIKIAFILLKKYYQSSNSILFWLGVSYVN